MLGLSARILIVQGVTSLRVVAAGAFASIALWPGRAGAALLVYLIAILSDVVDGFLARRLGVASELGGAYDGFADKAVTVVSVLYVLTRGAPVTPCCILLFRDLLVLSIRAIRVTTLPLLAASRVVGAVSGAAVRALTVYLLIARTQQNTFLIYAWTWLAAGTALALLVRDAWKSRNGFREALDVMKRMKTPE